MPWAVAAMFGSALAAARSQALAKEAQERAIIEQLRARGFDEEADLRQTILDGQIAARKQREAMAAMMAEEREKNAAKRGNVYRFPQDNYGASLYHNGQQTYRTTGVQNAFRVPPRVNLPEPMLIQEDSWASHLGMLVSLWVVLWNFV